MPPDDRGAALRRHGVTSLALLFTLGASIVPLAGLIALNPDTPLPIAVGVLGHLVASTLAVTFEPRPAWRDDPLLCELTRPVRPRRRSQRKPGGRQGRVT